jgi:3'-5' exoribonuclease
MIDTRTHHLAIGAAMARIPVAQLVLNMTLKKQPFLLRDKILSTTRVGNTMLRVILADRTGTVAGVMFDVPAHVADSLAIGSGVEVTGKVGEFRDQLQVSLERIVPTDLTNLEEFLPMARRPLEEMRAELDALLAAIAQPDLARLLDSILGDKDIYDAFTRAPAAKVNHHACIGGLLEHTLAVARIALTACDLYPELDRDLVLTVALLHDLGKIHAYDPVSFQLTEEGILWTHLYRGASMVEHAIDALPGFSPELRLRVVHAILAHHGRLEHGSPVVPSTLEAIVLHYADNLDGDARGAIDHMARASTDGGAFTDLSMMHDTRIYRGASDWPESTEANAAQRQPPLF